MSDIANGDFPEALSRNEEYMQDIIKNQLGESVDVNKFPTPLSRLEEYLQTIIKNQKNVAYVTGINLVIDSVGLITGGTATISDGSSVPITVTTEGDVITQAEINNGLDAIIKSEDSYIGE